MDYRFEVHSVEGLIQQLAVGYVSRGYWFYATGRIAAGKDPRLIDVKILDRYGIGISPWARSRRKNAGFANVQYIRFEDFFVLLATEPRGRHRFFEEEVLIRDLREVPIKFGGYSISYRKGHASVRIEQGVFSDLKAYLLDNAAHRSAGALERAFSQLQFEPYAPIRVQLLVLFRAVNKKRKAAGYEPLDRSCLRLRRRIVRPFDDLPGKAKLAA